MARARAPAAPCAHTSVAGNDGRAVCPGSRTAPLWNDRVVVQVGVGQPRPHGLPRGTILLIATAVQYDPQMALHTPEGQTEDAGHLGCTSAEARRGFGST